MKYAWRIIVVVMILLAVYGLASVAALGQSARLALQAKAEAQALANDVRQQQLNTVHIRLPIVLDRLERAQTWSRPSGWLAAVPFVRKPYGVYRDALTSAGQLSLSATQFFNEVSGGKPVNDISDLDFSKAGPAFLSMQQEFESALNSMRATAKEANALKTGLLPASFEEDLAHLQQLSSQTKIFVEQFSPLLADLPVLLGQDGPQDILILLENPHELRPTGGFIGTYSRLTIDHGAVTKFFTDDIYRVDEKWAGRETELAPAPFQKYAGLKYWYVRDANWSPDFPTSARDVLRLYEQATGEQGIDAVVAMTPRLVQEFLTITGPITVDNITFTSENLVDALQYRVEQEFWRIGLKDDERKKIINDLAQELRRRFFSLDSSQAQAFAVATRRVFAEKEILVYSTNPAVQEQVKKAGWSGRIPAVDHDLLAVVDANIGALKTDRLVDRFFDYQVNKRPDGQYEAVLQLTYKNNGHFDYRTTRYRTYTRVYVPAGAQLVSAQGLMTADKGASNAPAEVYTDLDKTVFAGFISVEPGQQRTATFRYLLPAAVAKQIDATGKYTLTVLKQPGTQPKLSGRFNQVLTADQTFHQDFKP
ncbi:MAG: DUF4012 domain-containing protein [Parcubacteria group bacterium]|nr:DUF4012 domain-containing protein [Parcubacteria group bacterium]